jgi:nucleotide-binding universal stress UspA family protein
VKLARPEHVASGLHHRLVMTAGPIVAATDLSAPSLTAVRLAAAMARRRRTSLILLHAFEPRAVDLALVPIPGNWELEMLATAERALEADAKELRAGSLEVEVKVERSAAPRAILDVARDVGAALIVLGTHGRRGAVRFFVGSCAEEVVRSSACPVLVTGAEVPDLDRWSGAQPLRLAVATDDSTASPAAFFWVRTSGDASPENVSIVRVYWPPHEAARYGLDDPWAGQYGHPDLVNLIERDLRRDSRALSGLHEPRIRFRVASHDAGEAIAEDVRHLGADAVVIGVPAHRRHTATGLTPASVLRGASVPVFCIPEAIQPIEPRISQVRSVLIASDLSEGSRAAVLRGYGLLPGGGRVELCFVHDLGPGDALADLAATPVLNDDERATIEAGLRAEVPAEASEHAITTHISVIEAGSAVEAVLQAAERFDVDLVVVGTHGRSGLKRAVLGSVAEQIARLSPRPIMLVRTPPEDRSRRVPT